MPDSGFFPDVNGDREYDMDFLAAYIGSFVSDGTYAGEMAVTADGSAMSVTVTHGRAWLGPSNRRYFKNLVADTTLAVANADGVLHRKDTVVLRWDINERTIVPLVLKGAPASSPIAPAIVRTVEQYDLKLAEISIPAGTTAITQALITDTRLDNSVCGIVHAVVDHIDTTALYAQIQSDLAQFKATNEAGFTAWVASLHDALDGETAGNLLNMINAINDSKGAVNGIATLDADGKVPGSQLTTPAALTISQGYGGSAGTYDGSAAVSVSVPHVTLNTAAPTGTLADGELWGVY